MTRFFRSGARQFASQNGHDRVRYTQVLVALGPGGAAHSTNGLWEDRVPPPPVSKCATAVTGEVPPGPRSIAELFAGGVPRLRGISGFPGRLNNWLVG